MKKPSIVLAVILLAAPFGSAAALADRPATPAERHKVGKILRAHGFVSWRKIERDDGKWEVDDAVTKTGKVYDVKVRGGRVVDWDRE